MNFYAVAVDSRRFELFEQIFTQDIRCDFGGGAGFTDLATFIAAFEQIHAGFSATQHMTSGHVVRVEGREAHCFSYVDGRFRRRLSDGEALFASTGWYDDILVRTGEGWRISRRISRMVSHTGDPRVMQAMRGVDTDYVLATLHEDADAGRSPFLQRLARPAQR